MLREKSTLQVVLCNENEQNGGFLAMKIVCRLLVNEHGDLYFLLHNFGAQIFLFMLKKFVGADKKI